MAVVRVDGGALWKRVIVASLRHPSCVRQGISARQLRGLGLVLSLALFAPVLYSQHFPGLRGASTPEQAAQVIVSTGRVGINYSGDYRTLLPGDKVNPGLEIFTGEDGYAVFQLNDGSTFEVFPNSRVVFRNNWGNWTDIFDIWVGRMKVKIEKLMGKPNPHRIHTPTAVISVRGTTFFVEVEEDTEATIVGVDEGEVAVEHRLLPTGKAARLRDGDQIRIDREEPIAKARVAKESVLRATLGALSEAMYVIAMQSQRGGGTAGSPAPGGGGGTPLPGDEAPKSPPPPPPPPGN
jgi:hypothetical protein